MINNLLIPANESVDIPELSLVIPALNEELTISEFVSWCKEGFEAANICGEILIVDSSTDNTAELAFRGGARVLKTARNGLGCAYKNALEHVRGKYIIMGDADCTYDFRAIKKFVDSFRLGNEFIMGSRFRGSIEPHSMPLLHRYFGTPLTTKVLNIIYRSKFTDIHCGMRGITKDAFVRMQLRSNSWEYASEMVLKSVQMQLKTDEVPVHFYKDRKGRLSHHKRSGWLSPWKAGWSNLRVILVNGSEFFALKPGVALFCSGLLLTLPATLGPIKLGFITLSLFWMLCGMSMAIIGLQSFYMGCLARIMHDYKGEARRFWLRFFSYDRSMLISIILFVLGVFLLIPLCYTYLRLDFKLPVEAVHEPHMAITGLLCVIVGFMNFVFTLVVQSITGTFVDDKS